MNRKSVLLAALLLLAPASVFASHTVEGRVFFDKNGNGILDAREKGIASVPVSDGFTVVLTDKDGAYTLDLNPRARFVTVYTPSGHRNTSRFYSDIRRFNSCGDNAKLKNSIDFGLSKAEDSGTFVQMSDIEELSYNEWIDKVKAYSVNSDADFVAFTGDICYAKGLQQIPGFLNDSTLGRRAVFCIGNHDLIQGSTDALGNPYGEKLFEDNFGPSWYAFAAGGVHFLITPMLAGDAKPSYSAEDLQAWAKAYLALLPEDAPVIVMNHEADNRVIPEGNVKAFFYGHRHMQHRTVNPETGIPFYCTMAPSGGGNDHCPSALRQVKYDRSGVISTSLHYFPLENHIRAHIATKGGVRTLCAAVYDAVSEAESVVARTAGGRKIALKRVDDFMWKALLPAAETAADIRIEASFSNGNRIAGKVEAEPALKWMDRLGAKPLFCNPVLDGTRIYIGTADNENAENCGVYCINAADGSREWFFRTKNSIHSDIALYDGVIYAGDTDYNIYAIKASDGTLLWSKRTAEVKYPVMSEGVFVCDGLVYFGTGTRLCALDPKDGSLVWQNTAKHSSITNISTNRAAAGVLLTNGYWVGRFAYDLKSGEQLWQLKDRLNKYSCSTPAVLDTTFIYTARNAMMQVGARGGEILRSETYPVQFYVKSEPLIVADRIIVGTSDGGVFGINLTDFSKAWQRQTRPALIYTAPYTQNREKTVESSPVAWKDNVIIGANDGLVYCFGQEKGAYQWHLDIGLPVLVKPLICGDDLVIIDFAGNIWCYDLAALALLTSKSN